MEPAMNWDAYFPIENTRNKERLFAQLDERSKYMSFDIDRVKSLIELLPEELLRYVTFYKFHSYLNFCLDISLDGKHAIYSLMSMDEIRDTNEAGATWVRDMTLRKLDNDKLSSTVFNYTWDKPISDLANVIISTVREDGRFN